jgi:hypothetical protein
MEPIALLCVARFVATLVAISGRLRFLDPMAETGFLEELGKDRAATTDTSVAPVAQTTTTGTGG